MGAHSLRKALQHETQEKDDDLETFLDVNSETGTDYPNDLTYWWSVFNESSQSANLWLLKN
jgi:hypothetical protein